jgi:hypothetical protein
MTAHEISTEWVAAVMLRNPKPSTSRQTQDRNTERKRLPQIQCKKLPLTDKQKLQSTVGRDDRPETRLRIQIS